MWLDNVVPGSKDLFISNSDSEISLNWVDHKATKKKFNFFRLGWRVNPFRNVDIFFSVTRLENYKWKNIQPCHREKTSKVALSRVRITRCDFLSFCPVIGKKLQKSHRVILTRDSAWVGQFRAFINMRNRTGQVGLVMAKDGLDFTWPKPPVDHFDVPLKILC